MYKRIIISVILSILIILISLGIASYLTVNDIIKRSLDKRVELAKMIAKHTDSIIESNFNRLYDISLSGGVDFGDNDWEPEKKALQAAYQYSIFTDGIFLLDKNGNTVLTYPPRLENAGNRLSIPYISMIILEGRPIISDIYTIEPLQKKVIFALVPLKNKNGDIVGVAGGEINPTNYMLTKVIRDIPAEPNTYVEIVDSHGIVMASNNPNRIFTCNDHNRFLGTLIKEKKSSVRTCHRCHSAKEKEMGMKDERSTDILAFAPLEMAPWGVSIVQPEKDVFEPASKLKKTFLVFSIGSIGIALLMAIGMSRSIVKPVHELIDATHKIASGDMSKSIGFGGVDEIGMLSSSFEVMRVKLADSLERLQQYNIQLEERVAERTKEIKQSQKKVENLLKKVISAQEDERKRIARGLHDETMQSLSAILMKMDMCRLHPEHAPGSQAEEMKNIVLNTLDGIRNIIQNLRPSILDDLGLEASIRWLLDKYLAEKGITYYFNIIGTQGKRFYTFIETTLFRILQEAIANIARHSDAQNVFVILKIDEDSINLDIEDDGKGFDVKSALRRTEDGRGLGLLGIKERAYLLDGNVQICSKPGSGTRVSLRIPLKSYGEENG
ncbi:MAG: ATP-binding protein [Nitrospirota bacterium]